MLSLEASASDNDRKKKHSIRRIGRIAELVNAKAYLEVGVALGRTFRFLDFPRKVGVDPNFKFDYEAHRRDGIDFFEMTSDDYFSDKAGSDKFDIIFLDGLHVFAQTYRDFENSIAHAHDRTVWLIDDVVPSDELSSLPNRGEVRRRRREMGIESGVWHGDIYKVMFAIHDFHPEYSFVTIKGGGNPQSIVWKAKRENVIPALGSMQAIEQLDYAEFVKRKETLNLRTEEEAMQILAASLQRQSAPA